MIRNDKKTYEFLALLNIKVLKKIHYSNIKLQTMQRWIQAIK